MALPVVVAPGGGPSITIAITKGENLADNFKGAARYAQAAWIVAMTTALVYLQRVVREEKLMGQVLKKRSGTLWRAVEYQEPEVTPGGLTGRLGVYRGPAAVYGPAHEYGARIVPRRRRYLTIPINPMAEGKHAQDFPDAFVFKSKTGALFLAQRALTYAKSLVLLFVLKKQVTLPVRSFLRSTLNEKKPVIVSFFGKANARILAQIIRGGFAEVRGRRG